MSNSTKIILSLLKERKITKAQLERECGLANGTIHKWEIGRNNPSYGAIIKISRFFEVPEDFILKGSACDNSIHCGDIRDNHGIIGHNHATATIINGKEVNIFTNVSQVILKNILAILKQRNITENQCLIDTNINTSFFTDWKSGKLKNPSIDKIFLISSYLGVSIDYLLGRTGTITETTTTAVNLEGLSSAQRSMAKHRLYELLINHYCDDAFIERAEYKQIFNDSKELIEHSLTWFKLPQDYLYDKKNIVPKLFKELNKNLQTIFNDFQIVLKSDTAKLLELPVKNAGDTVLVNAYDVFLKLSKLELKSVYELDKSLYNQITFRHQFPDPFADTFSGQTLADEVKTAILTAKNKI